MENTFALQITLKIDIKDGITENHIEKYINTENHINSHTVDGINENKI